MGNSSSNQQQLNFMLVQQDVCIHRDKNSTHTDYVSFPNGDYCIYGISSCPDGFTENQLNKDVALVEENQNPIFVQGIAFTSMIRIRVFEISLIYVHPVLIVRVDG